MSDLDLFVEIFPISSDALPPLTAFRVEVLPDVPPEHLRRLGNRIATYFRGAFGGIWRFLDGVVLTDSPRNIVEMDISLDLAIQQQPVRFDGLTGIGEAPDWSPTPQSIAELVIREKLRELNDEIKATLKKSEINLRNVHVERDHRVTAHIVAGDPALALSIASRLIYFQDVQTFSGNERNLKTLNDRLSGLWASDKTSRTRGEIISVSGTVAQFRSDLLDNATNPRMEQFIRDADDTEWVINLRVGSNSREVVARALDLIVRVPELSRFDVDADQAIKVLQMPPKIRAGLVAAISNIAKNAGLLQNAFNSRVTPDRFFSADFEKNVRYGTKASTRGARSSVIAYKPDTLAEDFTRRGPYFIHEDMYDSPIRVCVVNTLTLKLEDFVEALQRYLTRNLDFGIDVVRERRVRVVSRANLESAVRVVEKEDPDIILAFFPDDASFEEDDDSDEDATATYVKSLTLGHALPTHVIYESTLNDPDSMAQIVLGILGKTGNIPFVLAEPLEKTDFVVGLALVRNTRKTTDETRLTAIARVYGADGRFVRYSVREIVTQDTAPPYVLVRDLFPQKEFSGKRIVIHHDGPLPPDLLQALTVWAQAINATFFPVEIMRFGAPRLYGLGKTGITKPAWGNAFKISDKEALLVSSVPETDVTPQPLHIRTGGIGASSLPIEDALRSVLVWTLLTYVPGKPAKLPVTILNTDQLAYWLEKGNQFITPQGVVPFWL